MDLTRYNIIEDRGTGSHSNDDSGNKDQSTGSHNDIADHKIIVYPFEQYLIKVRLTSDDRFAGIEEIGFNKDFATYKQKIASIKNWDISKYYVDEEDEEEE